MAEFNRFNKGGNGGDRRGGFGDRNRRPSFGGKPSFGGGFGGNRGGKSFGDRRGGDRGDREMFKTTCSECKNSCEVPFKPTGEKPVFCNDCFSSKRNGDERGSERKFERKDFSRPERREDQGERRPEIRFHDEAGENKNSKKIENLENQIKNLNVKIESLTELYNSLQAKKAIVKEVEIKKPEVKKVEIKTETKVAAKKVASKVVAKKTAKKTVNKKK
jgi:CxxC-x17-CxxC domain-containing protein